MISERHDEEPAVLLRRASFGYDGTPYVMGLDLEVQAGSLLLILGCNGSGKSTAVKGMLGLAAHMGGEASIFGHDVGSRAAKSLLGYVPQRHTVGSPVPSTVREVVTSGILTRKGLFGRVNRADKQAVEEAIETVNLTHKVTTQVSKLSGGQQRRVLIARALAANPRLLFMDEPTAGVDAENQLELADTIGGLLDGTRTIVIISHDVGPLLPIARRAVVMDHGHKVYDGPLDEADVSITSPRIVTCDPHRHEHDTSPPTEGPHLLP